VIVSAELIGLIAAIHDCGTCRPYVGWLGLCEPHRDLLDEMFPRHCDDADCRACRVEVES
jgi:hypothetical protein